MKHLFFLLLATAAFGQNKLKQSPHKHLFSIEVHYEKRSSWLVVHPTKRGEFTPVKIHALVIMRRKRTKGKYIAYLCERTWKKRGDVEMWSHKEIRKDPDWEFYAYRVIVYDEKERLILSARNTKMRKFASVEDRIEEYALNQKKKYTIFNSRGFKLGEYEPKGEVR